MRSGNKVKPSVITKKSQIFGWSGEGQISTGNMVYWPRTYMGKDREKDSMVGSSQEKTTG